MKVNGLAEKSLCLFLSYDIEQSYLELEISIVQSKKVNYNRYPVLLARKKKKGKRNKRDQEKSSQVLNLSIR